MNEDRRNGRQQCPARPDDGRHAMSVVDGRGYRKSSRWISPRYQPDNLRRGRYSLFAYRGSGGGAAESNVGPRGNPYEAAFLAGKCSLVYRQRGGTKQSPLPDFLSAPTRRLAGIGWSPRVPRDV